jgi:hypothetical protein
MSSKLGITALAVAVGYLIFRLLLGSAKLLYLLCKIAVLLPIALFGLLAGNVSISRTDPSPKTVIPPKPAPDLGPATIESTGDWRQDRETLIRLLNEGKIK